MWRVSSAAGSPAAGFARPTWDLKVSGFQRIGEGVVNAKVASPVDLVLAKTASQPAPIAPLLMTGTQFSPPGSTLVVTAPQLPNLMTLTVPPSSAISVGRLRRNSNPPAPNQGRSIGNQ